MAYKISYTARAAQQVKKLDRQVMRRILARLEALAEEPRPSGYKQLEGHRGLYRVRVGHYRVVYRVQDAAEQVEVAIVAHRSEVYRDL